MRVVSFNRMNKDKFGSRKTKTINPDRFDGKERREELVITGTPEQTHEMKKHLEKEHPSTRGRMSIRNDKHYNTPEGHDKVERVKHEYGEGELKSHGKRVKSRKQAVAIALSEQRREEHEKNHKKPHYIKEPYGLDRDMQEKDKYRE